MPPTPSYTRGQALSILARADAEATKAYAETLLEALGDLRVLSNRSGLVVLPATDSAQGAQFHLGEVLVSEAHIALPDGTEGYGMCLGRDLVQALALAVCDVALASGLDSERVQAFIHAQAEAQRATDEHLLRQVEATRIEIETF